MGVELTNIYDNHRDAYDVEAAALVGQANILKAKNVRLAKTSQQSREINSQAGPCVIIASSPTCEFGRVLHHLTKSLEKEKDAVLFVGWTPPGTLGRRLQDGADRVRIFDRFYEVKAQVTTLPGMSGHADAGEMLRFLKPATDERSKTFVVHGEPDQSEIFAERIKKELGAQIASVPAIDSSVIL
jgi:metallo-beta-lactamase family protein